MNTTTALVVCRNCLCAGLALALLGACGASTRAPIRDQGREFPEQTPEIIGSGGPVVFQPVIDADSPASPGTYRVREGDSLYAIAFMYGIDYREIAAANDLAPPYTIYVDQELLLGDSAAAGGGASPAPTESAATVIPQAPVGDIQRGTIDASPAAPSAPSSAAWRWPLADRGATDYRPEINNRLDIEGRAGERVLAARDGEVVYARPFGDDEGTLLIIRHDDRYLSAYTQTGEVLVTTGERVAAGQPIVELAAAAEGPPMLYFNVQRDGAFVDPTALLP